jgi:two-component system, OmpR family, alkaline phosphatase synthesis response regulator PhoP
MAAEEKRILIVDDDEDLVEVTAQFLQANGYTVLKAHSGADGVRAARQERPHLILMDIMMSERTEGFFAIQEIRRTPDIASVPIFVVSALCGRLPDIDVPPHGGWMSHDLFLSKPVDMAVLIEKIRQRIGAPA